MKFETWVKQQIDANKKQIKSYQGEIKTRTAENKMLASEEAQLKRATTTQFTEDMRTQKLDEIAFKVRSNEQYVTTLEGKNRSLKAQNSTLTKLSKRKLAKVDGLLLHYGLLLEYAKKLNTSRLQVTASIRNNELQLHYRGKQGTNGLLSLFDITAQLTDAPNDLTYDTYTLEDVQACFKY